MTHAPITSLHSPHVERVKALLGPRGKKQRSLERRFVADGLQSLRSALRSPVPSAPLIEILYVTENGLRKLESEFSAEVLTKPETIMVTDQVMAAMTDTQSPQGMLALCKYLPAELDSFRNSSLRRIAYFWQIQDPGNAGTAIRTADACGFDLVVFSDLSVDIYSPKVVRSTAGSLWHIPVVSEVPLDDFQEFADNHQIALLALDGNTENLISTVPASDSMALVFGNEGRGLPELNAAFTKVRIPMKGHAESFNVASAAAIAMFSYSR